MAGYSAAVIIITEVMATTEGITSTVLRRTDILALAVDTEDTVVTVDTEDTIRDQTVIVSCGPIKQNAFLLKGVGGDKRVMCF